MVLYAIGFGVGFGWWVVLGFIVGTLWGGVGSLWVCLEAVRDCWWLVGECELCVLGDVCGSGGRALEGLVCW